MRFWLAVMAVAAISPGGMALAQDAGCIAEANLVQIAASQTPSALTASAAHLGSDYREQAGHAIRAAKLSPHSIDAAERLLKLLPETDDQLTTWMILSDPTCSTGLRNVSILARLAASAPRVVSGAAIVSPSYMDNYTRYILKVSRTVDPKDMDYVAPVCRAHHDVFVRAVNSLPTKDRNWFVAQVFEPGTCKEIRLPEAKD